MGNEILDPETAKAIQEASKFGTKFLDTADKAGGYTTGILGRLPHNVVGILDDWVLHVRVRRYAQLTEETLSILSRRGVKDREEPSPSIAIPLIDAALNETRDELKTLWAKLLAAALDPSRKNLVRLSLIKVLQQMEPFDALVLQEIYKQPGTWTPNGRDYMIARFKCQQEDVLVAFENLKDLKCINFVREPHIDPLMAPLGMMLMKAVRD